MVTGSLVEQYWNRSLELSTPREVGGQNKTTKLDKIYRAVLYPSQMKFCEGLSLCLMVHFPFTQGATQCDVPRILLFDT